MKRFLFSIFVWAIALNPSPLLAITIDKFEGLQEAEAISQTRPTDSSILSIATALGGNRSLQVASTAGRVQVSVDSQTCLRQGTAEFIPCFSHSQAAGATGHTTIVYDGDIQIGLNNPAGLGGIDLYETDSHGTRFASAFELDIVTFDFPSNMPVTLELTVYDASYNPANPASLRYSRANVVLNREYHYETLAIPFANLSILGPNGGADLSNAGAITLKIDGAFQDADLSLSYFRTNGPCTHVPINGLIRDRCDVCNGPGTSCLDCNGLPFGTAIRDVCGVCEGDGSSCLDCLQQPNGSATLDRCGVCNGDGTSCLDCDGQPFGTSIVDQCGICGGNGSSCLDCQGKPFGTATLDRCGVCAGDGTSCLGCRDVDQIFKLFELDSGALDQRNVVRKALRVLSTLRSDADTKSYVDSSIKQVESLYVRTWRLSWSLPLLVTSCRNTEYCASSSNKATIEDYRDNVNELYRILMRTLRKITSARSGRKTIKERLYEKRGRKYLRENLRLVSSIPESHTICTGPS